MNEIRVSLHHIERIRIAKSTYFVMRPRLRHAMDHRWPVLYRAGVPDGRFAEEHRVAEQVVVGNAEAPANIGQHLVDRPGRDAVPELSLIHISEPTRPY